MYIKTTGSAVTNYNPIVVTCPHCSKGGTFDTANDIRDCSYGTAEGPIIAGQRICPNSECRGQIFFIKTKDGTLLTYPPTRIDFDTENIPSGIKETFEEAITCHAEECFVASAIMVRRTLEELCEDKGCTGNNLSARIKNLKSSIVLPEGLLGALDELRLLGNDAAHIESKEYDEVGEEEAGIGIEITKEILKGVYQMDSLVDRLKKLKKT